MLKQCSSKALKSKELLKILINKWNAGTDKEFLKSAN